MTARILTATLVNETLELMSLIERTEEFADCHLWTGATNHDGYPIYKPRGCPCTLVRRATWALNGGTLKRYAPIEMTCGERLCVNPAHMRVTTTSAIAKNAAKRGGWKGKARAAKISAFKRASVGKLTADQASEIRFSEESGPVLAARYGVHRTLINGIKAGTRWKDYSSPWAGLVR